MDIRYRENIERRIARYHELIQGFADDKAEVITSAKNYGSMVDEDIKAFKAKIEELEGKLEDEAKTIREKNPLPLRGRGSDYPC